VENEKLSKQTLQHTWPRIPLGYDASESVQIYTLREKLGTFNLGAEKKLRVCFVFAHKYLF